MRPFLKLTGGKGIHIVVPLNPVLTWEELKKISKAIALEMVRTRPEWFVATVTKTEADRENPDGLSQEQPGGEHHRPLFHRRGTRARR